MPALLHETDRYYDKRHKSIAPLKIFGVRPKVWLARVEIVIN